MKIYTRTGDSGETGLFDGTRVAKSNPRVAAYGDVDELGAWLGAARAGRSGRATCARCSSRSSAICSRSALGWPIPRTGSPRASAKAAVGAEDIARLEGWIDTLEAELPPLRRFILAGGSPVGRSAARRADDLPPRRARDGRPRAGCRRARAADLLNRLSDLLFVWRAPRTTAPALPNSSGERRDSATRLTPLPAPGARALREFSRRLAPAAVADAPAHRRHLRVCADGRRLRRRARRRRRRAAAAARRLARTARPGSVSRQLRRQPVDDRTRSSSRWRTRFASRRLPMSLFDDLLSAFRQDVRAEALRDLGRRARLLPPLGQPGRPARAAGRRVRRRRRSTRVGRVCTALQLTNFWQDLERDWHNGRLYVPKPDRARAGAREEDLAARRMTPEWRQVMAEMVAAHTRAVRSRPRRLRRRRRPAALGAAPDLARRLAHSRSARSARLRRRSHRPTLGVGDAPATRRAIR